MFNPSSPRVEGEKYDPKICQFPPFSDESLYLSAAGALLERGQRMGGGPALEHAVGHVGDVLRLLAAIRPGRGQVGPPARDSLLPAAGRARAQLVHRLVAGRDIQRG